MDRRGELAFDEPTVGIIAMRAPAMTSFFVLTLVLSGAAAAQSGDARSAAPAAGAWETSMGVMVLEQNGASVTGTYALDGGRIVGEIRGNVLDGIWIENRSDRMCDAPGPDGRRYWGRIRFTFEAGWFAGSWGYCDEAPRDANAWRGARRSEATATPQVGPAPAAGGAEPPVNAGAGPRWEYVRTTLERPTPDQLGPDCQLLAADAADRGMRFSYQCKASDRKWYAGSANLDFNIQLPLALTPGAPVRASGRLTTAGSHSGMSGSCTLGVQGGAPTGLFDHLSAEANASAAASGQTTIPGPPWCAADGACPEMQLVCSITSTQALTMTRIYRWVR